MTNLVLTRGIPSSGKSTWARAWVAEDPVGRVRVNRDDLRYLMFERYVLPGTLEDAVTEAQTSAVTALLRAHWDVVVDDTNLSARTVRNWYAVAYDTGADVLFQDFEVDVEECVRRNAAREKAVSEDVIRRFATRYLKKGKLPQPPAPSFPAVPRPYVPNVEKPRAWLFDIDGTLAQMGDRSPYEWHRVGDDTPREAVVRAMKLVAHADLGDDNHPDAIIVMSGRDESCRAQTEEWLRRYAPHFDHLFMRPAGDMRKDSIIKAELFDRHVRDHFWVQGVYDDRDQVVRMWRAMGLDCFQVAPGGF